MKKIIFLLLAIFLLPVALQAQSPTYIAVGVNTSSFRTEEGISEPGTCFGIGKEFFPFRSFNGFVGIDLTYARKKVKLEDRTWPTGMVPELSDVVIGDIMLNVSYLEIPIRIGYSQCFKNGVINLQLFTGFSISVPIKNHKEGGKIKEIIILDPEERGKYKFDYIRTDEMSTSITTNILYGVRLDFWGHFVFGFVYSNAITNTEGFRQLSVSDKLDSFQFIIGYIF